jgi:hypothetical protein
MIATKSGQSEYLLPRRLGSLSRVQLGKATSAYGTAASAETTVGR